MTIAPAVREAFHRPPLYHRGSEFIGLFQHVRRRLAAWSAGRTWPCSTAAARSATRRWPPRWPPDRSPGGACVLVNGEFGDRLARQATRIGLEPRSPVVAVGPAVGPGRGRSRPGRRAGGKLGLGRPSGVEHGRAQRPARAGAVGRAHGASASVSTASAAWAPCRSIWRRLPGHGGDRQVARLVRRGGHRLRPGRPADRGGRPAGCRATSTCRPRSPATDRASRSRHPTLLALAAGLEEYASSEQSQARYQHYAGAGGPRARAACAGPSWSRWPPDAAPVRWSPRSRRRASTAPQEFVQRCRRWGFAIGGESSYLAERRLVQIATMGAVTRELCEPLFDHLRIESRRARAAEADIRTPIAALAE